MNIITRAGIILVFAALSVLAYIMAEQLILVILGILTYYILVPLALYFPLIILGPLVAKRLVNKPYIMDSEGVAQESNWGVFTNLIPGQVKILERNGRFIECIMKYPGHTFRGLKEDGIASNEAKFWEVVEAGNKPEFHPLTIPSFTLLDLLFGTYRYGWWFWKRAVYSLTGLVFTGIPPFQTVRIYPIEYFEESKTGGGKFELIRKKNFSDHFRVQPFDFFVPIESADTADKVPMSITIGFVARIFNPWMAAYNADKNWTTRVSNVVPSVVNDYTRSRPLDEILSGNDRGLNQAVLELGNRNTTDAPFPRIGLTLELVTTPDRSIADPSVLNETQRKLADVAFAKVEAKARAIRAEGDADAIKKQAKAIKDGGEEGRLAARIDGLVRLAEAAGDRAIINIGDGGSDPFIKGIYAETKKKE